MSNLYTPANARFFVELENNKTSINHNLDGDITSNSLLDDLTDAYGDIHYTIPAGMTMATAGVGDVCGVHFHDHSGCIVASRTGLSGSNVAQLQLTVRELLASLTCHEYQVTIETTRVIDGWETTTNNVSTVQATHPLAAVTQAYQSLMVGLLRELSVDDWEGAYGYEYLDNKARDLAPIVHRTQDSTHTLKSIKRVEYVATLHSI